MRFVWDKVKTVTFSDNVLHLANSYSDILFLCLVSFFKGGPLIQPLMCDLLFTSRVTALRDQSTSWERQLKRCSEASGKSSYYMRHEHISTHFFQVPLWVNVQWKMYQRWTSSFKPFSSCGKLVLRQTWCFCSFDSQRWSHVLGYLGQQKYNGLVGCRGEALATNPGLDLVGSECLEANVNSNENMLEFREVQNFSIQLINFDFQVVNSNHPEKLVNL